MRHFRAVPSKKITASTITAAGEEFIEEDDSGLSDALDDVQDQVEEIQDQVDDIDEDDVDIETNNNIDRHYLAECDRCHGIFISAVVESDQDVQSISGICPICQKESEQFLKWIIRSR